MPTSARLWSEKIVYNRATMPEGKKDHSNLYTPAAIIIAGLLIGAGLMFGLRGNGAAAPSAGSGTPPTVAVNIKDVKTAGDPYIGELSAPVTLAFWSDFQCPFCKAFEVGGVQGIPTPAALPDIVKNYVSTGKVKIVFKDFAFLGQDSITAAEYGRAVWKLYPDQYFAWRTAMYIAQDEEGDKGFGNAPSIDTLIKSKFPKMDDAALKADISKNKTAYDAAIQAETQEGSSFGINGTPGFITGKTEIDGAQAYSAFQSAFDAQLK
jgi:protein-disulfide isomerase